MTVQELIDELNEIEDKDAIVRHRVGEGVFGTELIWSIGVEDIYDETVVVIS